MGFLLNDKPSQKAILEEAFVFLTFGEWLSMPEIPILAHSPLCSIVETTAPLTSHSF